MKRAVVLLLVFGLVAATGPARGQAPSDGSISVAQLLLFDNPDGCTQDPCGWYRMWRGSSARPFHRQDRLGRRHAFGDYFPPTVSPDGRWLAFATSHRGIAIRRIAPASGKPLGPRRRLPAGRDAPAAVAWSPDGRQLVLMQGFGRKGLWIIGRDGTGLRRLPCACRIEVFAGVGVSWSARGIAFAGLVRQEGSSIFVVQPDGSGLRRVTFSPEGEDDQPVWSPDGSSIAFVREGSSVNVIPESGGEPRSVGAGEVVAWSPDGRSLVSAGEHGGRTALRVTEVESGRTRRLALPRGLARRGSVAGLAWRP